MPIIKNINQAKSSKYNKSRIIALDFGTRKFGLALSDPTLTIATPLANYQRTILNTDLNYLANQFASYAVSTLVIGLPKELNNEYKIIAQQVKSFANILNQKFILDIFFWDERYSSRAAARLTQHKEFKKENNDKISACVILQSFLDFRKN